jgi:hypothetical protein
MKMIFDVESNGLHGEGFAVGWVVVNEEGEVISQGYESCEVTNPDPWVAENVLPKLPSVTTKADNVSVRSAFWTAWLDAKSKGATLWADCAFPVETNFLSKCVADNPQERQWQAPYPLHEIATVFESVGWDSTAKFDRLEDEHEHHPTGDAKQSARLLMKALQESKAKC